ncbi:EAL domain-containing protein [Nitratifractor sp.]
MLRSLQEERSRHFRMALRIALPILVFFFALAYGVFFREAPISLTLQNVVILGGTVFAVVYFVFFALELSRKETLLDRVTEGYHYDAFLDHLKKHHPQTLAAVQVSNLGEINESFGVAKADAILRGVVRELDRYVLETVDRDGFIGRRMGSEILLGLDAPTPKVEAALEEMLEQVNRIGGVDVELRSAVIANTVDDPQKAIEQLHDLLHMQRSELPGPVPASADALEMSKEEYRILHALESGAIRLSFRPLLNLHTDRIDLYELSVYLEGEEGRRILPKEFLPVINRKEKGELYDRLVFEKVLEVAALIDPEIRFSFNLSPYSLRSDAFLQTMFDALDRSRVDPRRLIVEIYERRKYHSVERYFSYLRRLKGRGILLGLDNFGSSNASMEYLRSFPFDMIQFDRSFTKRIDNEMDRAMMRSLVAMAIERRILTAVKWVDREELLETFRAMGVDYAQGYAVASVLTESELIRRYNPA